MQDQLIALLAGRRGRFQMESGYHSEPWFDLGRLFADRKRLSDNRPLFHHKATLWEGGIRVPCLMRWPATLPRNQVIHQAAITMDLAATFLAAASARLPASYQPDGINLLPVLRHAGRVMPQLDSGPRSAG